MSTRAVVNALWWCLGLSIFLSFTFHDLPSPDLWWQMALGRMTVMNAAVPSADPFSFTAQGHPWCADEWLAGVIFFLLHEHGGLNLLHVFKSLLLVAAFGLFVLAPVLAGRAAPPWALAAGLAAMLFSEHAFFFDVRTYLFTYLFLALTILLLELHHARPSSLLYALPLVILLWANVHAGFVAGLLVIGVYVLAAAFSRGRGREAAGLAVALAASVLASLLNAHGVGTLLAPFEMMGSPFKAHLNEWAPPRLLGAHAYVLCWIVLTWGALVILRRRMRLHDWGLCLLFTAMAVSAWRHIPLFAFFSLSIWAPALQALGEAMTRRSFKASYATAGTIVLLVVALAALGHGVWRLADPALGRQSMEKRLFPCWAAKFLMANSLPADLFHPYGWGGYLIWETWPRYRVFIDGRAIEVYPMEVYRDYLRISTGSPKALDILQARGVKAALTFTPGGPEATSRIFDGAKGWRMVYEDDLCRIFLKDGSFPGKLVHPPNPHSLAARAREAFVKRDFARMDSLLAEALRLDDRYAPAYFLSGARAFARGDSGAGVAMTRRALQLDPRLEGAHFNLAVDARARGDRRTAIEELRRELENNGENRDARALLLRMEAGR